MNNIKNLFFTVLFCTILIGVNVSTVFAQSADYGQKVTADSAGLDTTVTELPPLIGSILGNLLSMVGVVFFVLMIYGGFLWMTARGNEEQTSKAFGTILAASIGILIVMGAYAITNFVFTSVTTASTPTTQASP